MLKQENRYDFKKELLVVHKPDRRNFDLKNEENEFVIPNGLNIVLPDENDKVILHAAKDFVDYLMTSMKLSSMIVFEKSDAVCLTISLNKDIGEASGYMGYRISVKDDGINLEGYDSRGVAQGLYFLEDLMNLRKSPFLEKKVIERKAVFNCRMIQSPFGMFDFNDECLSTMAHFGYDTIDLWLNDFDLSNKNEFIDVGFLCERAEKYGIGINIQLFKKHSMNPEDPKAEEFYDKMYGDFLRKCPKVCGVTIIPEAASVESGKPVKPPYSDSIPNRDFTAGENPTEGYAELMVVLEKVIHKINPDIRLVFSMYNWCRHTEEDRVSFIEKLPKSVIVELAWDLAKKYSIGNIKEHVADYSLRMAEPSEVFVSNAKATNRLGNEILAITNTAGRTWDFGCAPYEPMPYQWIKRFEEVLSAHDNLGLNGLRECIHYGFHPSIVTELSKWAFFSPKENLEEILQKLLKRDFGEENLDTVDKAMKLWSDAVTHYIPTNENQYGPYRIGPSYPIWINDDAMYYQNGGKMQFEDHAMYKGFMYRSFYNLDPCAKHSLLNNRMGTELNENETMANLIDEGVKILETIQNPNDKLLRLINLGKYLYRNCITTINVMKAYTLKHKLLSTDSVLEAEKVVNQLEQLLLDEKANVEATIPIVKQDSRLGWEPSMDYVGDEKCLNWKLRQLNHELTITLPNYKNAVEITK